MHADERDITVAETAGAAEMETGRLEAFSDGVFAIAITLLVLNLGVPHGAGLLKQLDKQWASYVAYTISFVTILIMWVNHHALFRLIRRTDHALLICNGVLLLFVTVVPFPTSVLASYLTSAKLEDAKLAALLYSASFVLISLGYDLIWFYAVGRDRLLSASVAPAQVRAMSQSYKLGPTLYLAACALAFVNVWASVALNAGLAVFWALPRHRASRARAA